MRRGFYTPDPPATDREKKVKIDIMSRTSFSKFDLTTALEKVGLRKLTEWNLQIQAKVPSSYFQENMRRLRRFDTARSEGAKLLIADAFFEETIQPYEKLRIFKETTINSTDIGGLVDYLIAPDGTVPVMPFLCVSEAKKDDFDKGLAQCLVEMQACFEINQQGSHQSIIYGIVTNGSTWQFYKRDISGEVFESSTYGTSSAEMILGILDYIFAECENNLP
jgi:hypothetical protein